MDPEDFLARKRAGAYRSRTHGIRARPRTYAQLNEYRHRLQLSWPDFLHYLVLLLRKVSP